MDNAGVALHDWEGIDVGREAVIVVSSEAEQAVPGRRGEVSLDDLARRKGVRPIADPRSMAYGAFSSDDELAEFHAFIREQRHADLA